ncbi:hypothetical protein HRbin27_01805 [bacterium HR27]|nr:hypothetical protein HRbin27_01805 [bacterium HR27]
MEFPHALAQPLQSALELDLVLLGRLGADLELRGGGGKIGERARQLADLLRLVTRGFLQRSQRTLQRSEVGNMSTRPAAGPENERERCNEPGENDRTDQHRDSRRVVHPRSLSITVRSCLVVRS